MSWSGTERGWMNVFQSAVPLSDLICWSFALSHRVKSGGCLQADLTPEEREEKIIILKKQFTGHMRFIGEIYMKVSYLDGWLGCLSCRCWMHLSEDHCEWQCFSSSRSSIWCSVVLNKCRWFLQDLVKAKIMERCIEELMSSDEVIQKRVVGWGFRYGGVMAYRRQSFASFYWKVTTLY